MKRVLYLLEIFYYYIMIILMIILLTLIKYV